MPAPKIRPGQSNNQMRVAVLYSSIVERQEGILSVLCVLHLVPYSSSSSQQGTEFDFSVRFGGMAKSGGWNCSSVRVL